MIGKRPAGYPLNGSVEAGLVVATDGRFSQARAADTLPFWLRRGGGERGAWSEKAKRRKGDGCPQRIR
jgi:hypothetical protein